MIARVWCNRPLNGDAGAVPVSITYCSVGAQLISRPMSNQGCSRAGGLRNNPRRKTHGGPFGVSVRAKATKLAAFQAAERSLCWLRALPHTGNFDRSRGLPSWSPSRTGVPSNTAYMPWKTICICCGGNNGEGLALTGVRQALPSAGLVGASVSRVSPAPITEPTRRGVRRQRPRLLAALFPPFVGCRSCAVDVHPRTLAACAHAGVRAIVPSRPTLRGCASSVGW